MPLFRKKPESLIPPVSPSSSTIDSRSSSLTYVASRDGDAPSSDKSSDLLASRYNRNRGAGDVYSRGIAELDKDRDELFSGYKPTKSGSGRFFDGPDLATGEEGDDDDVERIKQQTRFVKQESVNSTRNALRLAREAEETGRNTLTRLGEQSRELSLHYIAFCLILLYRGVGGHRSLS
jgi:protein transport protein SEC9